MTYKPNPDIEVWQIAAVALCEYACNGALGRRKDNPVYIEVTEHRDGPRPIDRKNYSSCGDLGWWLLFRLGLRRAWMNRAANGTYNIGMNVADLTGCPPHMAAPSDPAYVPSPGDILEIWNDTGPFTKDAHVCVALGCPEPGKIRIANFGLGGMSEALEPGSGIRTVDYKQVGGGHLVGARRLRVVVPLARIVPLLSEQVDLTGAELPGEVIDALQAKWSDVAVPNA